MKLHWSPRSPFVRKVMMRYGILLDVAGVVVVTALVHLLVPLLR